MNIKIAEFAPSSTAYIVLVFITLLFGVALGRGINGEKIRLRMDISALWIGGAVVVALYLATPFVVSILNRHLFTDGDLQRFGQIGDLFGFVNALFSCLALIGVLISLRMGQAGQKETTQMAARTAAIEVLTVQINDERDAVRSFANQLKPDSLGRTLSEQLDGALSNADYVKGMIPGLEEAQAVSVENRAVLLETHGGESSQYADMDRRVVVLNILLISARRLRDDLLRRDTLVRELVPMLLPDPDE
jgi:hypothetical protein